MIAIIWFKIVLLGFVVTCSIFSAITAGIKLSSGPKTTEIGLGPWKF